MAYSRSYLFILLMYVVNFTHSLDADCPTLTDADNLSQTQLIQRLAHVCRYDRLERPVTYDNNQQRQPIDVYARAYIYFMQNLEAQSLQFTIHALLQLRFLDPRLSFHKVAPSRRQPMMGEKQLRDLLWMPHIFLANERDSSILGTNEQDILTSISPDGTVIVSSRIKATLYCWMNLQKFPFDEQHCSTVLESWMYNTSELVLHWEQKRPITFDPDLHLTEYVIQKAWPNETVINADLKDLRHGAFAGNYSSLRFTVHLTREVGFYLMDYFLPSIMIVAISWVSFWLQADQSPPRIMLGTSTMLTFITLASAQGKTLPKVSYIKISEVWFLGCTVFIFGSLIEFAFVNTIWRRKNCVDVKKVNSKNILRSTLSPKLSRRGQIRRSHSFATKDDAHSKNSANESVKFNNYLTVHSIPVTTIEEEDEILNTGSMETSLSNSGNNSDSAKRQKLNRMEQERNTCTIELACNDESDGISNNSWTTLTPQEISMWIDRKSRCVFPMAFLIFNAFFWSFVYVM